jgi:uncharacterized membrane protein
MNQFESLLQKWTKESAISPETAKKMKSDWESSSAETASDRWTLALSLLGATCLGIAAIAFISTNWEELNRFEKMGIFILSTLSSFGIGAFLHSAKTKFTGTGHAFLFLSTLLFGATLALISQLYHMSGPVWALLALWTAGVLPLAYIFRLKSIFQLSVLLSALTVLTNISQAQGLTLEDMFESLFESFLLFPSLLIIGGLVFALGNLHFLSPHLNTFGKILKLWGVRIFLFFLFLLTFIDIAEDIIDDSADYLGDFPAYFWKNIVLILLTIAIFIAPKIISAEKNKKKKQSEKKRNISENIVFGSSLFLALLFLIETTNSLGMTPFLVVISNVFFLTLAIFTLREGYKKHNLEAINFAIFAIGIFLFGKYIDLFADELDTTAFFFLGGVLFIGGGVFLERKRRELIQSFQA